MSVDFYPTDKGLARKDGRVYLAPKQFTYHDEAMVVEDGEGRLEDGGGLDDVPALVAENETVGGLSEEVGMVDNV